MSEASERLLAAVDDDAVLRYTRDLVRHPSVNPPGEYGPVTDYVLDAFRDLDLEISTTSCHAGRTNVVGRLAGTGEGTPLCLAAHTDVVGVGDTSRWSFDPFGATVSDGILQGRGTADSKGMLAGMMSAVRAFREADLTPGGDLYLVAYVDDETAGPCGLRDAYRAGLVGADRVILGEATDFQVRHVFKARLWFSVEVIGRSSHGAFPERGVNAIDKAFRVMEAVRAIPLRDHEILGRDTVSIGMIRGGDQVNVSAGRCTVWFDVRWSPPRTSSEIREEVRRALEAAAEEDGEMEIGAVEVTEERDPLVFDARSDLNDAIRAASADVLGRDAGVGGWYSSGELWPVWSNGDIETGAVVGPGEPWQAHAYDEQIPVADLVASARIYALTALGICGAG